MGRSGSGCRLRFTGCGVSSVLPGEARVLEDTGLTAWLLSLLEALDLMAFRGQANTGVQATEAHADDGRLFSDDVNIRLTAR